MLRVSLAVVILCMLSSASPKFRLFTASSIEDEIEGEPKFVRVERQVSQNIPNHDPQSKVVLYATVEYVPGGRKSKKCVYHPDGAISSCESYEYDSQGRLFEVKSLSATGAEVQVQKVRWLDQWTDERVTLDAVGKEVDCTITKRDSSGAVIESISIDRSQSSQIHLYFKRDSKGEIVGGEVVFETKGEITSRVELTSHMNNQMLSKLCQSDGTVLVRTEMSEDSGAGKDLNQILSVTDDSRSLTIEHIESKDAKGNWITKTISQRDGTTQGSDSVVRVHRSITYY